MWRVWCNCAQQWTVTVQPAALCKQARAWRVAPRSMPTRRRPARPHHAPLCSGHQSFSNNKALNDFVGNIVHSSIMVPYHGWRISHRTHHANVRRRRMVAGCVCSGLAAGRLWASSSGCSSRCCHWTDLSCHGALMPAPLAACRCPPPDSTATWRTMRAGTPPPSPTTRRWTSEH